MKQILTFLNKLSKLDTERAANEVERHKMIMINKLIIFMVVKFLFLDLIYNVIIGEEIGIVFFSLLPLLLIWSLYREFRFNKDLHFLTYLILSLVIFIFTSNTGKNGLVYLNYIPLLLSIVLIFDIKKDKTQIAIILLSIVAGISINIITDFQLFASKKLNYSGQLNVAYFTISQVIVLSAIICYFIYENYKFVKSIPHRPPQTTEKNIDSTEVSDEDLMALAQLAREDRQVFIQKALVIFSGFYQKIDAINPNWVSSELEVCFLLKLNFSTKDIAQITNSSVRAIEAKKYRIRKKMNIPSHQDISIWLNNL